MWTKRRHKIIVALVKPLFKIIGFFKFGYRYKKYKLNKKEAYIIVSNHQTVFDHFMYGLAFNRNLYYIATEDIFSMGFLSKLLKFAVAPIPKSKSMRDSQTVRISMQVVKEKGVIMVSPEGNRTYSGETAYIDPAIAKFVKLLKVTLIIFNITGGYGVHPRWANKSRKGKTFGEVVKILTYDEYKDLSNEELYDIIKTNLYVDDTTTKNTYKSKKSAEYCERFLYVCPNCGITKIYSKGEYIYCPECELKVKYNENLEFEVVEGKFNFLNMKEWYHYQEDFVSKLNFEKFKEEEVIFSDEGVFLLKQEKNVKKINILEGQIVLYKNRITINNNKKDYTFYFDDIDAMTALGKNKLGFYLNDETFQVKSNVRFNPVKYMHLFYHYKNTQKGEKDDFRSSEFLGL
ncbi:MAG: 1-acyl-sn-glycerol-3-phosphate acyltransferase [Bacilli bacterium]